VSATPTFDDDLCPRWTRAASVAVLLLPMLVSFGPQAALGAEENEPSTDFFSYFPAPPELKLPSIDITPFWTSDLKVARKAYRNGNYERALKYFQKESEEGSPTADWYLGHMYRLGRGVKADPAIAYTYYSRVAEAYDSDEPNKNRLRIAVDSQLWLAHYLRVGVAGSGIAPDPARAARTFLRLASNYGHPGAMFALGKMNLVGEGVQKNPQQGLKWLMAAARKRNPEAEALLGDLYEKGEVVRGDETRSLMWYLLAAENASENEHRHILERSQQKFRAASPDVQLEADARAKVWAEEFPSPKQGGE
jgi:TPR repeat protein